MRDFRLYVIIDEGMCKGLGIDVVEIARKIILAEADILQLRAKRLPQAQVIELGWAIKRLLQKSNTLFIINDRAEIARALNANGIHLGQDDLPIKEARNILGSDKIIGFSAHNATEACAAERQGVDYIGIGPIFATALKPELSPITPKIIPEIKSKINIPFVAIGGINLDNLEQVLDAGAQRIAVSSAIVAAQDAVKVTREFRRRLYKETSPCDYALGPALKHNRSAAN